MGECEGEKEILWLPISACRELENAAPGGERAASHAILLLHAFILLNMRRTNRVRVHLSLYEISKRIERRRHI